MAWAGALRWGLNRRLDRGGGSESAPRLPSTFAETHQANITCQTVRASCKRRTAGGDDDQGKQSGRSQQAMEILKRHLRIRLNLVRQTSTDLQIKQGDGGLHR